MAVVQHALAVPVHPTATIFLLVIIVVWGASIWGIIDAATRSDGQWLQAGQNKILWVVLQLVLGIVGTVVYVVAIRPKLGPRTG